MKKLIVLLALPLIAEETKPPAKPIITAEEKLVISQLQSQLLSLQLQAMDVQRKLQDAVDKTQKEHGCQLGQDLNCVKQNEVKK